MIIRIDEIQALSSELELKFAPTEFDSLGEEIMLRTPAQATIQLKKVGLDIEVRGQIATELQLECCRCLEPQVLSIQKDFHAIYRDIKWMDTKEEVELEEEDLVVSYYSENSLNLLEVAREQIILTIPLQFFCKRDCAGLCSQCGQNLNFKKCSCRDDKVDPRLAILSKLKYN